MSAPTPLSLRSRRWKTPTLDKDVLHLMVDLGAEPAIAPILAARGMKPQDVPGFLKPDLRQHMPDPFTFRDMEQAVARVTAALENQEKIAVWSDYDVDGATSAAILLDYLNACGHKATLRIPDRILEGYGPNPQGIRDLHKDGHSLIVVLDAGTVAFEPLEEAQKRGVDVVVIDHHAALDTLPPAVAIVNPNRKDETPGHGHLCAAGMTFLFVVALNVRLRERGWFEHKELPQPAMAAFLDLVALATVCDVVPLIGLNRAFVQRGLRELSTRKRPGIAALAAVARLEPTIQTRDCGFALGPRLNAGGRIGDSTMGARLLLTQNPIEAQTLAERLDELNHERQQMEKSCTQDALAEIPKTFEPGRTREALVLCVNAHEGVVGISAARVKDHTDAPTILLTPTEDGVCKGSGRSVPGFDLGRAILEARDAGLLLKGGGHAMAAGLSLKHENIESLTAFLNEKVTSSPYGREGLETRIDLVLPLQQATVGRVQALATLAPFGMGNPSPTVLIENVRLEKITALANHNLKCVLTDPQEGHFSNRLNAFVWGAGDSVFGQTLLAMEGQIVDVVGHLDVQNHQGKPQVRMRLDDLRPRTQPN